MKHSFFVQRRILPVSILIILCTSCFPLSTGSLKWRITWDKKMLQGKEFFMEAKSSAKKDSPPNVIVLVADDLGRFEVSAYEGVDHISTPNIDQIGHEGAIFTDAYCTAPTCAPSRAGIMTGRVQNRYGFETQLMEFYPTNMIEFLSGKYLTDTEDFIMQDNPIFPREWHIHKQGVPPSEINMAEALKKYGYTTGLTGKWHLGSSKHHVPLKRGFDYHYGFNGAFTLYTAEQEASNMVHYIQNSFSAKHQWEHGRSGDGAITENGKVIIEKEYLTFAIKNKAIDFIRENKDNPFFLYCAFSAPHVPFQAPVDYYCQYDHVEDDNKRVYYSMISALDDAIGEINQAVKNMGLEENTIIYVLSDNGGASYTKATDNGPLKGGKLMQFEGGVRIPFMMKWPKEIEPGIVYRKPVSTTDIFVTSVLNAGGELPKDRHYDGVDLVPYLKNEMDSNPHDQLFWRADHIWAIRDGNYKLILSTRDGWAELYNLEEDISEEINLKESMPEMYCTLREMHEFWQTELPDKPMWPRIMDHKFIIDCKEYHFPA